MKLLLLMLILCLVVCFIVYRQPSIRANWLNWLYLISSALAWYSLETVNRNEPIHQTILIVLLLCLMPLVLDGLLFSLKTAKANKLLWQNSGRSF